MVLFTFFIVTLLFLPAIARAERISGDIEVHFIDVGEADAILILSPRRDCTMLIDSGDVRYPGSSKTFMNYMLTRLPKGSPINLAIASNPHVNNIGNMQWVLENYSVQTYVDNGQFLDSTVYRRLMTTVNKQVKEKKLHYFPYTGTSVKDQDFCPAENLNTSFLYSKTTNNQNSCANNQNNCSVVVKMQYDNSSFLFPGGAEIEQERLLLADSATRRELKSDVLKVGAHGSDVGSSVAFLASVSPKFAVISVGRKDVSVNRMYKHPRLLTVTNLQNIVGGQGTNERFIDAYDSIKKQWVKQPIYGNLYVTANDGHIVLVSDGRVIKRKEALGTPVKIAVQPRGESISLGQQTEVDISLLNTANQKVKARNDLECAPLTGEKS